MVPQAPAPEAPALDAPGNLGAVLRQRKREAAEERGPEPEAPAPQPVGKAGNRSAFLDKMIDAGDWLGKGVGLVKEADDTAGLYGKDIPEVIDQVGEADERLRDGADSALGMYAPIQERMQRIGAVTTAANKMINPLPKVSLGKVGGVDIKLGVGTKDAIGLATGVAKIAQYHKNEGADPLATAGSERAAVDAGQMQFRRGLEARRRAARLYDKSLTSAFGGRDPAGTPEGRVQEMLGEEKKRANLVAMRNGMRLALRAGQLGKAQEKKGVRPLNEYSMEQTAYLNDREYVPQKPLGFFENEHKRDWAPKKGMLDDNGEIAKASDLAGPAAQSVFDRYSKAQEGQDLPEGLMPGMRDNPELAAMGDDYRDEIEGGRAKQKIVAPFRFGKRAGELVEGTLNTDRMVRDGRYKTAYGAKLADTVLTSGAKAGAGATQAGLLAATGGVAAPLIAAAEAGKTLALHAKEQVGLGLQWTSEKAEGLVDRQGLAKKQDMIDLHNKHYGLQKPPAPPAPEQPVQEQTLEQVLDDQGSDRAGSQEQADRDGSEDRSMQMSSAVGGQMSSIAEVSEQLEQDESRGTGVESAVSLQQERESQGSLPQLEQAPEQQADPAPEVAADPLADPSARAEDIRARGIHWEKQGDRSVLGRRKRTWGRAIKDATWGGVKKVGKGLLSGIGALVTLPIAAAKWGWKGLKALGSGLRPKKKETPNSARVALKQLQGDAKIGDLDRPQFDWSSIKKADADLLSKEDQYQLRMHREKYDEVFGTKAHAKAKRVGGTRQAAKDALLAKPEVERAEQTAALREQFAPGPNTPRMASEEILDLLRGRARQDIADEEMPAQAPEGGGPGAGGPGGNDGGGPGGGDLLDQMRALEGEEAGSASASVSGQDVIPSEEQEPPRPASVESEMIDTSGGQPGVQANQPIAGPSEDDQEAAFTQAFGQNAAENYYMSHPEAKQGAHLKAATQGYFSAPRPHFDPYGAEAHAQATRDAAEAGLAALPAGPEAELADQEMLRGHRAEMQDWDARLEDFHQRDPSAFASGGERRMAEWDMNNPRPAFPETTDKRREKLLAERAYYADPRKYALEKFGEHRNAVEVYRRKQQYLQRYAPESPVTNPDLGSFDAEQAGLDNIMSAYAARQPRPAGGGGPMMRQLIGGEWVMAPEEEKGAAQPDLAADDFDRDSVRSVSDFDDRQTDVMYRMSGEFDGFEQMGELDGLEQMGELEPQIEQPQIEQPGVVDSQDAAGRPPKSARRGGAEMLDASAGGVRRSEMLMDPRELALLKNAADPSRAARRLPAIKAAVGKAQGAETKDDATSAWRDVDRLQRGMVNRRWSQNGLASLGGLAAADARQAQRADLLGRAPLIDASTRHEGLELPEAQVEDRRLEAGDTDQQRLPDFNLPGDEFNIFEHGEDEYGYLNRMLDRPRDYMPEVAANRDDDAVRRGIVTAFRRDPALRRNLQMRDVELAREAESKINMETKRPLFGDPKKHGKFDSLPTDDADAHKGPITVDNREVVPELRGGVEPFERQGEDRILYGKNYLKPFGGDWRDKETNQVVQHAGTRGALEPGAYGEVHADAIAPEKRVNAPAAGWDQLKKPGWFAGAAKKEAYREQKAAAQATVADAFKKMKRDAPPKFLENSKFGKKEWARLEQQRQAQAEALRMRALGRPNPLLTGNVLFGVVGEPARRPDKDRKRK